MSHPNRRLLILDDDRLLGDAVGQALSDLPIEIVSAHSGAAGLNFCAQHQVDIVLLDQKLPDANGVDFCKPILNCNDRTKIIFITAYPSFENAVQAIKVGAYDYLSKPFEIGELHLTVSNALRTLELENFEQVQHYTSSQERHRCILIGSTAGLSQVQQMVALAAGNRSPVLITGETGTGKSIVAKAIHYLSTAADKPFLGINCAALPENLVEAELFGYEKGAFTGAAAATKGIFEMAADGTLFLDEIGEIPLHLQSKLLGVLDENQFKPIGGQRFKSVHARVIAATNTDLETAIRQRRFREDLYYRLSVVRIHVPPLRERLQDLPDLCRYFAAQIAADQAIRISNEELAALAAYSWPGNVRELRNVIERAILVRRGPEIFPSRLLSAGNPAAPPPSAAAGSQCMVDLNSLEKAHIAKALAAFNGNHTHAARALGISRSTLLRKLSIFSLDAAAGKSYSVSK
jgi:DNA-binding NtrC family response regulator